MASPIGLSASDIFKAIEVVGVIIDALRKESKSGASYRSLIAQLHSLETALILVNELDASTEQYVQVAALHQAASQCRHTIDAFLKEVSNYQPHLGASSGNMGFKTSWYKIKWALCRKDDLEKFQMALISHTGSINALLQFIQAEKQNQMHRSLAGLFQDVSRRWLSSMSPITNGINQTLRQGQKLFNIAVMIHQTNLRAFQMIVEMHQVVMTLPAQVQHNHSASIVDPFNTDPASQHTVHSNQLTQALLEEDSTMHSNVVQLRFVSRQRTFFVQAMIDLRLEHTVLPYHLLSQLGYDVSSLARYDPPVFAA